MRNVTFGKKVSIVGVCAVLAMAEVMPVAAAESGTLLASGCYSQQVWDLY